MGKNTVNQLPITTSFNIQRCVTPQANAPFCCNVQQKIVDWGKWSATQHEALIIEYFVTPNAPPTRYISGALYPFNVKLQIS
ncbi:hypothetical protein H6G64_19465 [Calothrix sp. FACHB-156]|nr:hypothetical protein [Calothrix sp. FACHB-156]